MEPDNFNWLDIIAAKRKHKVLNLYLKDKELFFDEFMIIDDPDFLIIGSKKTFATYEFAKTKDTFFYEYNTERNKTLLKFLNIEVVKKELV